MKIIQILPELNSGGVERGVLELGAFLSQKGHESIVISNGGQLIKTLEDQGSRHISLPVHRKHPASLLQVKKLREIFTQEKPDIIHIRSRVPAWIAWLAWRKMPKENRPHLVSTVHGFYSVNAYSKIMTCGEAVICVSNSTKNYVTSNYPNTPEEKLHVIHRGVDSSEYPQGYQPNQKWLDQWYQDFPETKNKLLLTLPGRITRLKGHHDLLEILKKLDNTQYHAVIAGGAQPKKQSYLLELQQKIQEIGLSSQVTITGHRSDLKDILSISHIVFSLTSQPESFGRTTLEALCLGKPVIGYNHGGVGEILDKMFPEGKTAAHDTSSAIKKIKEWKNRPPTPASSNPFTLDAMLNSTLNLYKQLTDQ